MANERVIPSRGVPGSHSSSGFTLIEVLVVISIVSVLIAILLPSLAGARRSALSVQCLSNQRTLGQISLIYADSHNDYHVPASSGPGTWTVVLMGFFDGIPPHLALTNLQSEYYCPDLARQGYDGNSAPIANYLTNYVINNTGATGDRGPFGDAAQPSRYSKFKDQSNTAVLWDARGLPTGVPNRPVVATYWAHMRTGDTNGTVGYVHISGNLSNNFRSGAANFLYMDGHASPLKDPGDFVYPDIARQSHPNFWWE